MWKDGYKIDLTLLSEPQCKLYTSVERLSEKDYISCAYIDYNLPKEFKGGIHLDDNNPECLKAMAKIFPDVELFHYAQSGDFFWIPIKI